MDLPERVWIEPETDLKQAIHAVARRIRRYDRYVTSLVVSLFIR